MSYARASPGVFRTLDIAMVHGRDISEQDTVTSPWVAVINQTMAKRFWPNQEPLGKRFTIDVVDGGRPREVVGVVADLRQRLQEPPSPQAYVPYTQVPEIQRAGRAPRWMSYIVRTSDDSANLLPSIRQVVREADPNQPVSEIRSMTQVRDLWMAGPRLYMVLVVVFAGIALILATIGIYGMVAYAVTSPDTRDRHSYGAGRSPQLRSTAHHTAGTAAGVGRFLVGPGRIAGTHTSAIQRTVRGAAARPRNAGRRGRGPECGRIGGLLHPGPPRHTHRSSGSAPLRVKHRMKVAWTIGFRGPRSAGGKKPSPAPRLLLGKALCHT
jgi:hypothetical protein